MHIEKIRARREKRSYKIGTERAVQKYQSEEEKSYRRRKIIERDKVKVVDLVADAFKFSRKEEENQ